MPILIKRTDGGASIMHLQAGAVAAEELAKWEESHPGQLGMSVEIDAKDIPTDRRFRDAWTCADDGSINLDLEGAREIQLGRIRAERDAKLAALDVDVVRAVGQRDNAKVAEIEAKKQALRDAPTTLASTLKAAATPDEIAAVTLP